MKFTSSITETCLGELLHDLGLEHHLKKKLTLSRVLEIDGESVTDENIQSLKSLPWCFLRRLLMVNVTARSVSLLNTLHNQRSHCNMVNPLDLITALFFCSDGFLQQEMVLKMSMCQFSVPLLLPGNDEQQCTLMVWAMRDIVKKYRPHSLADPRGFVEESIVLANLPMVSFVRLGKSSLSKSHILNQVLSNPQQYHDTFVHHNMVCGDAPRRISNGLVEISWYLPCGNRNIDIFSEPVAIANLRGDITNFETQYSFLCRTSSAVFVFCDDFESNCMLLNSHHFNTRLFLISDSQSGSFNVDNFRRHVSSLQLQPDHIIMKHPQMNDAEFVDTMRAAIGNLLKQNPFKMSVEQMSAVAHEFGIPVDEDYVHCKTGKEKADAITTRISDIPSYKEKELPLQGNPWKELAKLEKEECRLKKAGKKDIEMYRNELCKQKQKLRAQQGAHDISDAMSCFISAMSSSEERSYFLKWMRINLDNLSRRNLSCLREKYKEQCQNSTENKERITELDRKISSCSLGTEHFIREMGQLYESACSLPENCASRQQMKDLPRLCAELLLEGFPLELVDGDASNIPMKWVTEVLNELHCLTKSKSKIRVVTVLGVQSTGKSTLLNTMFGVQFAVSSGRCTRGAFMLLIRVKDDFKDELRCDYIMVIDTEGLKSPELAQLDDSYEHDNELATLVVGLSDITIINIAMENSTEMKDILQIVVHAFLRMKEVGKKPCCHFVHQNVADVSAHEKNMRDRKILLQQLNEMTQAAAQMEKRGNNKNFTDVMDYVPERNTWYIPGLWHGNPPMAPVSAAYTEAVNVFKRSVIEMLKDHRSVKHLPQMFPQFLEWTRSLWAAVKYENFIFSFRNSLVADAYAKLCTEFNKWEWAFRKNMHTWLTQAETKVSNFNAESSFDAPDLLSDLINEAVLELANREKQILDNILEYYKRQEGHVYLVEKYKEDFVNTAKSIRRETENSVKNKIEAAVEIRKGMFRLETIKKNHTATMQQKVLKLIERYRQVKTPLTETQLEDEFGNMWNETVAELRFSGLERRNIVADIHRQLWANLERKGGSVQEMLSNVVKLDQCGIKPFKVDIDDEGIFKKYWHKIVGAEQKKRLQRMANYIISCSKQFVGETVEKKTDYHNTNIIDLLQMVDENLEKNRDLVTNTQFEASLKIHICGHAAREFQKMHEDFMRMNDPRHCLEQFKDHYCADFKDLFYETDQCQKKAEEFTYYCLAPAIGKYVEKSLGPDVVDEMLTGKKAKDFNTRVFFQFSVLSQLLSDGDFNNYLKYTCEYESFVEKWIFEKIVEQFSIEDGILKNMEQKRLNEIINKIKEAVVNEQRKAREKETGNFVEDRNIQQFIHNICSNLHNELVIPKDALEAVLALNSAKPEEFSQSLMTVIEEMEQALSAEFHRDVNVRAKLSGLPFKPQKELFRRVFGCGKQCPFCKAPCEAGGKSHTEHFASVHRPRGIGGYSKVASEKLVLDICSSCISSELTFCNSKTDGKFHPYKEYHAIYPDWCIQSDTSIQASDYWKYVLVQFHKEFCKEYSAKPADIPPDWTLIDKKKAMDSLRESFMI
ncbi:up-regulator of cell proliferation-like [Megalops cyprinoides]|uniref:up-regulator of cell proliferation-like n=1 Tax=Megalops cyprinoides TaxID=118141 RepID=UPI001864CBB7|nr:up-regulator of cell proliferation-like [Megalops cyprinoides]